MVLTSITHIGTETLEVFLLDCSVLTDGSTDSAISENEAVFKIYFDPGVEKIKMVACFPKLVFLKSAAAYGILFDSISDTFKVVNIDNFYEKAILKEENPWFTFGWCVAHRLELALKDSLKGTAFDDIILRLHYLYKKLAKKIRQLKELVVIYEEAEERAVVIVLKKLQVMVYSFICLVPEIYLF